MLLSMTGFCAKEIELKPDSEDKTLYLSAEIKTLNSRFFESTAKFPSFLSSMEGKVTALLRSRLVRGRTFLSIRSIGDCSQFENLIFSKKIAKAYLESSKVMKTELGVSGELNIENLMTMPYLFSIEKEAVGQEVIKQLLDQINLVIDEVISSRAEEGRFLERDLKEHLSICEGLIEKVKTRNHEMLEALKLRAVEVMRRVQDKNCENGEAQAKLDEVNHQLDKIDVHEEISRFEAHLSAAQNFIASDAVQKGKKLDFIFQELVRETNTLAAKCSDYQVASLAVDIKVELEKVREQAQNVV